MRAALIVGPLVVALGLTACASALPADPAGAALYRDLQRLVTVRATGGWEVDRVEIDELLSVALMSVCQVTPAGRLHLLSWLDAESRRRGGPVEEAWRRRGKRLDRVEELLELARVRMLLARAVEVAPDDCPFWLEPDLAFHGRQISDDRWQLSVGGGGKGILVHQADRTDLNFGGAGRVVIGRNFGRSGLYVGLELGASAGFPKDDAGGRGGLQFGLDAVTPIVYRYTLVNAYVEGEVGYLAHTTEEARGELDHGVHVGVAIGGRATRKRLLFPGAVLGLSYERSFPGGDTVAPLHAIKLGFRVALDWDW